MFNKILYFIGWSLSKLYLLIYHRYNIYNKKRIPNPKRGMLIASNHSSYIDPMVVGTSFNFPIWFLVRITLLTNARFFGWLLSHLNTIPISRTRLDLKPLRQAKKVCSDNNYILIFPEGTRSKNGRLQKGLAGVGLFADKINVDILPVYVDGAYEAFPRDSKLPRPVKVRINIGEPLKIEQWHDIPKGRERYQAIADDIMCAINKLKTELENLK